MYSAVLTHALSPLPTIPRAALAIIVAAFPLHLALALGTDLSPDEAYYLCAGRRSGFLPLIVDHPPLLPWLLRLSDHLPGPVELRVRVWALFFSSATSLACVELARRRGAERQGCLLAAWVSSWALLPTTGGFVTTPDGPALLAFALALLAMGSMDERLTLRRCALATVALALGTLSKVVVLPIALLLTRKAPRPAEKALLLAGPILVLPLFAPSLRFQIHHAFVQGPEEGYSLLGAAAAILGAISAQALLWSPAVLWRGHGALWLLPREDRSIALVLSAAVLLSALLRAVPPEPNWWAPAALIVVLAFARTAADLAKRAHFAMVASVLLPTAVAAAHTLRPFLPLPERADPTARLHGFRQGRPPLEAAGVGLYGPAAERCVYQEDCEEINKYFNKIKLNEKGFF